MPDTLSALHKAIRLAIKSAVDPVKVYDAVPQKASYPYVVLDGQETSNDNYLAIERTQHFFYLTIWSQTRGQSEVLSLMNQISDAINRQKLTLDQGQATDLIVTRKRTLREPDGRTFQGQMTIRTLTQN